MTKIQIIFFALFLVSTGCTDKNPSVQPSTADWEDTFRSQLTLLGHRNWILVADKAFPEQTSPGIDYMYVDRDLPSTLQFVLDEIDSSSHVSPVFYRDRELYFLTDEDVPGVEQFRAESDAILNGWKVETLLHEDVFSLLDETSSQFRILVIKTNCTFPYTTVFIRLDCGYWTPEQEKVLRLRMQNP